ncbi:MAG: DMT family transporter, partial [Phocaeicola sp.]
LFCLIAQISFSFYLAIFKGLIGKYNVFTLMKWMFTYATICFIPFSYNDFTKVDFAALSTSTWWCIAYVVLAATFLAYVLMMVGQKALRPTVVSMYNYVQPIVSTTVSILIGIGTFGIAKGIAVGLVFSGVYLVTQSKSREQLLAEKEV